MPVIDHVTQAACIGTTITLTVKNQAGAVVDISSADTTKKMRIKKPDGTVSEVDAGFTGNDGTDGKLTYSTIITTFPDGGEGEVWLVQAYLVMTGFTGYTSAINVQVWPNL